MHGSERVACSQTLYFTFKVRRARVIKNKHRGRFTNRQRKGVGVREEEYFSRSTLVLARSLRSPMFSKRRKRKIRQCLCTGQAGERGSILTFTRDLPYIVSILFTCGGTEKLCDSGSPP